MEAHRVGWDGILDPDNGVDSDADALTDWEEVDIDRISWDTDGSVILPTIQDCIGFVEKGYAEEGLTRYKQEHPVIVRSLEQKVFHGVDRFHCIIQIVQVS